MRRRIGRDGRHCRSGKVRYRDRTSAQRAIATLQRGSNRSVVPRRAYECPDCHGWHVTSKPYRGDLAT